MVKTEVETVTVALPAELVARVRGALEGSGSLSNDEIVSDALVEWHRDHDLGGLDVETVRKLVQEAKDDPRPHVPMEEVMDRLEARYRALAEQAQTK